jgi:hypothetical protein
MLLVAFAMMPILLIVFVAPNTGNQSAGSATLPIVVSALAVAGAGYWLMNRMDPDQTPSQFQTNMLIALAFGELSTLMGVFIAAPAGMSPYPFAGANYLVIVLTALKTMGYWNSRPAS